MFRNNTQVELTEFSVSLFVVKFYLSLSFYWLFLSYCLP